MKTIIRLSALLMSLLVFVACIATMPAENTSPLVVPGDSGEGGDSPLMVVSATPSATVSSQPVITATVVLTTSPTITPVEPTAPPAPENTDTPVPTNTPLPEPTDTPTPEPPPTSTPTTTPTEGPTPTPTPLPSGVFIRDHRSVRRGSDMLVVGEVSNGLGSPVYNVTVSAAFYDSSGSLIGAAEAAAFLPQALPTQNNPFKLRLPNAPASVSTYELALRWDDLTALGYDRVTIVGEEVDTDNGVTIHGELRNDGFSSITEIVVAISFYDAGGQVLDTYQGNASTKTLAPGATTTYSIETGHSDLEYDHFLVQAQGLLGR